MVEHGAIPQLLRALNSSEARVVEAVVRSLKMVYKVRRCSACTPFGQNAVAPGNRVLPDGLTFDSKA